MDEQSKINKDTVTKFKAIDKVLENIDSKVKEVGSSNHLVINMMKMLETQVGQLAGRLTTNEGKLPGQPKGPESAKAIQTRWGKETKDPERSAGARKPKPSAEAEEFAKEEVTEIVKDRYGEPERGESMGADKNSSRRRRKLQQDEHGFQHTSPTHYPNWPSPRSHWSATGPRNQHTTFRPKISAEHQTSSPLTNTDQTSEHHQSDRSLLVRVDTSTKWLHTGQAGATHLDVHPSKNPPRVAPVRPVKSTGQTGVAWAARDEQHPRVNSPKTKPRSPESLHGLEQDFGDNRNTS
jgi:hypothetical protein